MIVCECARDKCIIYVGDREVIRGIYERPVAAAGAAVRSVQVFELCQL